MYSFFLFFFFSSRRRHTRCYRDWSSDVCSSDLEYICKTASLLSLLMPSWQSPSAETESTGRLGAGEGKCTSGERQARPCIESGRPTPPVSLLSLSARMDAPWLL